MSEEQSLSEAKPSRLWWWFVAAFILQALAWTAWFIIAAHNRVAEVPLVTG
jgi:heme/copper-type cytochrome/quinol oxidase subunit 2